MTPLGWLFMLCSVTLVLTLVVFCFWRVLNTPKTTEHMHAPLDIDTRDADT
ncbi:MAG TPA: hypothetical protein VLM89_14560 [Phycisphaerae bacterium]|nr:hypothetical protein [Phycisphaerae bacterium]